MDCDFPPVVSSPATQAWGPNTNTISIVQSHSNNSQINSTPDASEEMQKILREKEQMAREIQMLKEQSKSLMEKVEALMMKSKPVENAPLSSPPPPVDMEQLVAMTARAVMQQMQSQQSAEPHLYNIATTESQYAQFIEWQNQQQQGISQQRQQNLEQPFEDEVARNFANDLGAGDANTSAISNMSVNDSVDSCLTKRLNE
jgi:chromosome segregation ATPase